MCMDNEGLDSVQTHSSGQKWKSRHHNLELALASNYVGSMTTSNPSHMNQLSWTISSAEWTNLRMQLSESPQDPEGSFAAAIFHNQFHIMAHGKSEWNGSQVKHGTESQIENPALHEKARLKLTGTRQSDQTKVNGKERTLATSPRTWLPDVTRAFLQVLDKNAWQKDI